MSDAADTPPIEKTYLPAEASLLATSVVCLPIGAVLAWVASGVGVPPWLLDFVGNILLKGRHEPFQHFTAFSLDQKAIVALASLLLFAFGAYRLEALFGLPRLAVTKDGIALRTLSGTKRAEWSSLGKFNVIRYRNGRRAEADRVGPDASQSFLFRKTFIIPDVFSTDIEEIVGDINAARVAVLGLSPKFAAEDTPSAGGLRASLALFAGVFVVTLLGVFAATHH